MWQHCNEQICSGDGRNGRGGGQKYQKHEEKKRSKLTFASLPDATNPQRGTVEDGCWTQVKTWSMISLTKGRQEQAR